MDILIGIAVSIITVYLGIDLLLWWKNNGKS